MSKNIENTLFYYNAKLTELHICEKLKELRKSESILRDILSDGGCGDKVDAFELIVTETKIEIMEKILSAFAGKLEDLKSVSIKYAEVIAAMEKDKVEPKNNMDQLRKMRERLKKNTG